MKSSYLSNRKRNCGAYFRIQIVQKCFLVITFATLTLLLVLICGEKWLQPIMMGVGGGLSGRWNSNKIESKSYKNYFLNAARLKDMGLVVNTTHCKITDFNPWDEEVMPFIKTAQPLEDCLKTNYNWSHIEADVLVMNAEAMKADGYLFSDESCCYKIITRKSDDNLIAEKLADNSISYSRCVPINEERTRIDAEFIVVECAWSRFTNVHYRGFHGIATSERNGRREKIQGKVDFWKNKKSSNQDEELPPSILVVGLDSTSRINFRRNMFKTHEVLQSLGAIEMFGYTKVGENTFPNFCPMFLGYSMEDMLKMCMPTYMTYQDDCPSIWKQLDAANYLTAQTEDSPDFTAFNYRKVGFANQPVDFYVRPLFLAALDYARPYTLNMIRGDHIDCVSYQTNDEAITTYMESSMDFAHKNKAPIFSFSWSTTLAHGDLNMIQLVDETYSTFLTRMITKGYLNNTILIFMGDHGYRFGAVRETLIGYYEDKLPNLWIRLPPRIQEKYPDWQKSLETNSRRLTSPYHFYWTLNHVIQTFSPSVLPPQPAKDLKTGDVIDRKYVQNFLESVPETNSCSDVGVPDRYCACYHVVSLPLSDSNLLEGAERAVEKVNYDLNPEGDESKNICVKLSVGKITAGAKMHKDGIIRYIVGFVTFPGEFLLEAEIDFLVKNNTFSGVPNVQRASKIDQRHVKCVQDPKVELFCFCKDYAT